MLYSIYFIKTPKCATETIKIHLNKYSEFTGLKINDGHYKSYFDSKYDGFDINTNHIYSNEETWKHFLENKKPGNPFIRVTSIRTPLLRLYSHYRYSNGYFLKLQRDFNDWYLEFCDKTDNQNECGWKDENVPNTTNNYISKYMNVENVGQLSEKYDFVFVSDLFDESLISFGNIIGHKFTKVGPANVISKQTESYQFSKEVISKFNERNVLDLELFTHCYNKIKQSIY